MEQSQQEYEYGKKKKEMEEWELRWARFVYTQVRSMKCPKQHPENINTKDISRQMVLSFNLKENLLLCLSSLTVRKKTLKCAEILY